MTRSDKKRQEAKKINSCSYILVVDIIYYVMLFVVVQQTSLEPRLLTIIN